MKNKDIRLKKKRKMKAIFSITLLVLGSIVLFVSCKKSNASTCDDNKTCYTDAPDSLWVKLDLANESYDNPIRVKFYIGNMDDGELYDEFQTTDDEAYYLVPVDERYTATAQFLVNENDTVIVIDSEKLNQSSCKDGNATCYDWDHEITLDLKIK